MAEAYVDCEKLGTPRAKINTRCRRLKSFNPWKDSRTPDPESLRVHNERCYLRRL